jgi:hypothetical protein
MPQSMPMEMCNTRRAVGIERYESTTAIFESSTKAIA